MDCVCGHAKEAHDPDCIIGWSVTDARSKCKCRAYRECLPWPNEAGWWWCSFGPHTNPTIVASITHEGKGGQCVRVLGEAWPQGPHEHSFGPARFTKLIETSPFTGSK